MLHPAGRAPWEGPSAGTLQERGLRGEGSLGKCFCMYIKVVHVNISITIHYNNITITIYLDLYMYTHTDTYTRDLIHNCK